MKVIQVKYSRKLKALVSNRKCNLIKDCSFFSNEIMHSDVLRGRNITKFVSPWQNTNRTFFFSRKLSKTDPASSSHLDVKKRMWISTSLKYPHTAHWWFPQHCKDSKVWCFLCARGTTLWFVRTGNCSSMKMSRKTNHYSFYFWYLSWNQAF